LWERLHQALYTRVRHTEAPKPRLNKAIRGLEQTRRALVAACLRIDGGANIAFGENH
jgi:hypothetical protein